MGVPRVFLAVGLGHAAGAAAHARAARPLVGDAPPRRRGRRATRTRRWGGKVVAHRGAAARVQYSFSPGGRGGGTPPRWRGLRRGPCRGAAAASGATRRLPRRRPRGAGAIRAATAVATDAAAATAAAADAQAATAVGGGPALEGIPGRRGGCCVAAPAAVDRIGWACFAHAAPVGIAAVLGLTAGSCACSRQGSRGTHHRCTGRDGCDGIRLRLLLRGRKHTALDRAHLSVSCGPDSGRWMMTRGVLERRLTYLSTP